MPQLENKEILNRILRTTINVISRRTSEAYANVIIGGTIKDLAEKYNFLNHVEIQGTQYTELFDVVTIKSDLVNIEPEEVGKAVNEFIEKITKLMGKNAGYYFIKEIKEDLPNDYEQKIKGMGIDLDYLQLEFLTEIKNSFKLQINNADVLKNSIKILFDIIDKDLGRDTSVKIMSELVDRLSTEYDVFRYVKINDIRAIRGVDIVTVAQEVNEIEPTRVGVAIQKIIQEINNALSERGNFSLIEKLKNYFNAEYNFKFSEIGVNLDVIQLGIGLVIKHVLIALVDVLSDSSNQNYAIIIVNNIIKKFENEFEYLKQIKIDSAHLSEGEIEVNISSDIESVNPSQLGKGIQRIIEEITLTLGEDAGRHFIEKFKKRLKKAYILRIEDLGVNLHMIELRQNLVW